MNISGIVIVIMFCLVVVNSNVVFARKKISDVFAAYTAEYPNIDKYNARMYPNKAYLCVSFRVVEPTEVKIRWKVVGEDGVIRFYAISTDHDEADELGDLQPGLYNKCFHPPELEPGRYFMRVNVKPRRGIAVDSDECKFEVAGFKEE